jgi:outer membrane protein
MRRNLVVGLLALIAMTVGAAPALAQQNARIGFINSQRILAEAPGAAEAQQAFEADMARYRAQMDSLETALEEAQSAYQRQQATLDEAARRARQQELQQQFAGYQQRVAELEQVAQRRQAELVQPIMQRISEVIEQLREREGYAMIFDASAGALITADPSLDLTDQVLALLRASAEQ